MRRVMVRYQTKPDRAEENERYVGAVFEQLQREHPAGVRYATFKLDDGVTFVHIASIETDDGSNPLAALEAFRSFTAGIRDRCVQPPVTTELHAVGAYGFFDAG